jgi:L-ribulokinase
MARKPGEDFVLGMDFGSDSCRAVIVDAADGSEGGSAVEWYPRWAKGLYCDPGQNRFRQHPRDYLETLEGAVKKAALQAGKEALSRIRGIAVDTTGATPCAVDEEGTPLSLKPGFEENPSAMFVLWKDHSANGEAAEINRLAKTWGGTDFTKYEGGAHASEWFWAKALHILREDQEVAAALYSFLEHCDWITGLLAGNASLRTLKRSRGVMGHKGLWHREFGGYPSEEFLKLLDPRLVTLRNSLGTETWTSDTRAGGLSAEWAERLGLPQGIPVAVGAVDCYIGAVGGGVEPGRLVMVVGTSTCDMTVTPLPQGPEKLVRGLAGQIEGSMIPGLIGHESGQSAFGDVYAWFRKLLLWPLENILPQVTDKGEAEKLLAAVSKRLIPELEKEAEKLEPGSSGVLALDWFNGRRSPDLATELKAAVTGLTLGTCAVRFYRALAEATVFGARAIIDRFRKEGIHIDNIVAVGGVARKSSLVMQILADVLKMPIQVSRADQAAALGSAMYAAVAAGLYGDIPGAQKAMGAPIEKVYEPNRAYAALYDRLYEEYRRLGAFVEENARFRPRPPGSAAP